MTIARVNEAIKSISCCKEIKYDQNSNVKNIDLRYTT